MNSSWLCFTTRFNGRQIWWIRWAGEESEVSPSFLTVRLPDPFSHTGRTCSFTGRNALLDWAGDLCLSNIRENTECRDWSWLFWTERVSTLVFRIRLVPLTLCQKGLDPSPMTLYLSFSPFGLKKRSSWKNGFSRCMWSLHTIICFPVKNSRTQSLILQAHISVQQETTTDRVSMSVAFSGTQFFFLKPWNMYSREATHRKRVVQPNQILPSRIWFFLFASTLHVSLCVTLENGLIFRTTTTTHGPQFSRVVGAKGWGVGRLYVPSV